MDGKAQILQLLLADWRQIALEQRMGQAECVGDHSALAVACVYCGAVR